MEPVSPRSSLSAAQARRRLTDRSALPLACGLLVLAAAGDLATGIELPFTILYLLPIGLATWFRSRRSGAVLSVLATISIALSAEHDGMAGFAVAWNALPAAGLFVLATGALDRLHAYVEHERAQRRLAIDQLRHADRLNVIGTLAAGVAHELGTPLGVIGGCAELLAEGSADEEVRQRARMILEQSAKMSAIVRQLVDFGRRGTAERTRVELGGVARAAAALLAAAARRRGCAIAVIPGPRVHARASATELEQVLSNLVVNALQAMERGTVTLRVGERTRSGQRLAALEVEDQGSGIAPEDLPRIFDPFFTTKGVGEGTGLGLSVSYGIVRDHGGSIDVFSAPGRGSRFLVLLPRCE